MGEQDNKDEKEIEVEIDPDGGSLPPEEASADAEEVRPARAYYHLVADIDDESTRLLSETLLSAKAEPDCKIEILITSGGGNPDCAFALYDLIRSLPNEVTTVAAGNADSAATIIFLAGDIRVMMPNASILLHTPIANLSGQKFRLQDIKYMYENMESLFEHILEVVASRTGVDLETLKEFCHQNKDLTAKEAVEFGFAHKIGYEPKK